MVRSYNADEWGKDLWAVTIEISLTMGLFAIIDEEDIDLVSGRKWRTNKTATTIYAVSGYSLSKARIALGYKNSTFIALHRLVTNCPLGLVVDHINGNDLDNTKKNLRICSHKENIAKSNTACSVNPTGLRGVFALKDSKSFQAKFRNKHIGCFKTADLAAKAYDAVAFKEFGEFAALNFPNDYLLTPS